MDESKYILPEGIEVKKVSRELWIGKDNRGYSEKSTAVYSLAIDKKCDICGKPVGNTCYTLCPACSAIKDSERYYELEEVEWDGETILCIYGDDTYFSYEDEIYDYCNDNEIKVSDLHLVLCEKNKPRPFNLYDVIDDVLPEDAESSDYAGAQEVEDVVNDWLGKQTFSWIGSNKRVNIKGE